MGLIYKWFIYLIKMVIFRIYIKWPEGNEGLYLIAAEEWDEIQLERFTGLVWSRVGSGTRSFHYRLQGCLPDPNWKDHRVILQIWSWFPSFSF